MRDFSGIPEPDVFTLSDLVYRLGLRTASKSGDRINALLSRAIQDAIRSLPAKHDWSYFRRQSRFTSSAQTTHTVTYDHTGGAYERLLTITDGDDWPEDATYGEIRIADLTYRISRRISDTEATLEADFSLQEDLAATAVVWQRRAYQYTRECTRVHYVHNTTIDRPVLFLPSSEMQMLSYDDWLGSSYTKWFTYQNHGGRFGSSEFILLPPPINAETFEISATVNPHIPQVIAVGGVDLAGTSGAYTITSANAAFNSKHVGCVLRISLDEESPTDDKSSNWDFQTFVTAVPTSTTLTLADPLPATYTAQGYVVSSPIDIDASTMLEYVEDEAFFQYTKNHDHKSVELANKIARGSLIQAIARDNKISSNSRLWEDHWHGVNGFRLSGIVEVPAAE